MPSGVWRRALKRANTKIAEAEAHIGRGSCRSAAMNSYAEAKSSLGVLEGICLATGNPEADPNCDLGAVDELAGRLQTLRGGIDGCFFTAARAFG
jgi:hypothetical protein